MLTFWPQDDSAEWLSPVDIALATQVAAEFDLGDRPLSILEIGVWKGAWSISMALNHGGPVDLAGIDPYPRNDAVRQGMLERMRAAGLGGSFRLYGGWDGLLVDRLGGSWGSGFDIIHIDGEHSEAAAARDLSAAESVLAAGGVLIVNDIAHPYFPGVASATYRFLDRAGFAMFLYSRNKAYLCRSEDHDGWYQAMSSGLDASPLVVERQYGDSSDSIVDYAQGSDVAGKAVLLCVDPHNVGIVFESSGIGNHTSRYRTVARDFMPPRLLRWARRWVRG